MGLAIIPKSLLHECSPGRWSAASMDRLSQLEIRCMIRPIWWRRNGLRLEPDGGDWSVCS